LNPAGDKVFHACPDWPWHPPSPVYDGCWFIPWGKAVGNGSNQPPPSNVEAKERVYLHLYFPLCSFMGGYRVKFISEL